MAFVRDHSPPGISIAAGEYAWDLADLARMALLRRRAASRRDAFAAVITAFIRAEGIARANGFRCLRTARLPPRCTRAAPASRSWHMEYFHDHSRIESMLFDGVALPKRRRVAAGLTRDGVGIEFARAPA
jgi:hypothetical protein